jgi:hypothetical protein
LADTLQSPQFTQLPTQLGDFVGTLGDLAKRLQPLGQLAESAGGLFGLRALTSLRSGGAATKPVIPPPAADPEPAKQAPAKKTAAKKTAAKKTAAKKTAAKKTAAKKTAPKSGTTVRRG